MVAAALINHIGGRASYGSGMEYSLDLDQAAARTHRARSEFLDAFGGLEAQLLKLLRSGKKPVNAAQTTALLEAFRKLEATPLIAKANLPKRDTLAARIDELLPVRADIVHSRMIVHMVGNDCEVRFVNARNSHEKHPQSRNLTIAQLEALIRDVGALTDELSGLNQSA